LIIVVCTIIEENLYNMDAELTQQYLFDKHSKIFAQHKLPMQQTCMCWGLQIGKGWYPLIDELCEQIQANVDSRGIRQIEATSVKEKFSSLRFSVNYYDPEIDKIIRRTQYKASKTCESCSSPGEEVEHGGYPEIQCKNCS
jgi:hypothetical protein